MVLGKGASSSLSMNKVDGAEEMVDNSNNFTVLVADDDPLIQKLHEMHLKKFGLKVQVVENGKKAVDLCHFGATFNLILIDKEMPVMDGAEATKELQAMGVNSLIVGVTSRDSPYEKQAFMEAGLDYCFEKPLTADKINFLLQELNKNN
ncbi:two-component response regulator ARR22-like [Durio zibethinus]|uniref:Two-component response regulator ARR22-like n=1 Tax=Durio zibethinus TaxID=66656 RepID=A0A6P5YY99_DURZI|nr:two-component response regulator ARR22-like [Durio zibethinus]